MKKYYMDENAWEKESHEGAYYLGLIYADGNLFKKTNKNCQISISSKDREIPYGLRDFLKTNKPVYFNRGYYSIQISSQKLFNQLESLGCCVNKTFILDKPNISEEYLYSFFAGFVDGDGSISKNSTINSWKVGFGTASPRLADWMLSFFKKEHFIFSTEKRILKSGKPFIYFCFVAILGKIFCDRIYENTKDICLKRKYSRYLEMCELQLNTPNYQDWEKEYIINELDNLKCQQMILQDYRNIGKWVRSTGSLRFKRKQYANIKT